MKVSFRTVGEKKPDSIYIETDEKLHQYDELRLYTDNTSDIFIAKKWIEKSIPNLYEVTVTDLKPGNIPDLKLEIWRNDTRKASTDERGIITHMLPQPAANLTTRTQKNGELDSLVLNFDRGDPDNTDQYICYRKKTSNNCYRITGSDWTRLHQIDDDYIVTKHEVDGLQNTADDICIDKQITYFDYRVINCQKSDNEEMEFSCSDIEFKTCSISEISGPHKLTGVVDGNNLNALSALIILVPLALSYLYYKYEHTRLTEMVRRIVKKWKMIHPAPKLMLIDESRITRQHKLGSGNFGDVYLAQVAPIGNRSRIRRMNDKLQESNHSGDIALKLMRKSLPAIDHETFLEEAALYATFEHANVVKLIGMVLANDNVSIYVATEVLEGSLLDALKQSEDDIPLDIQLRIMMDCAEGMRYLASINYVHRDLAARNVLVSRLILQHKYMVAKINDFGLTRLMTQPSDENGAGEPYFLDNQRQKLPIWTMAPESLDNRIFTEKSDVWSFGVLMWEIFTKARKRVHLIDTHRIKQVSAYLRANNRLPIPVKVDSRMEKLCRRCWETAPKSRPTFDSLVCTFRSMKAPK